MGFVAWMMPSIAEQMLELGLDAGFGDDEEEIDERLENIMLRSTIGGLPMALPIAGNIPAGLMYGGNITFAPTITKLNRAATGMTSGLFKLAEGEELSLSQFKGMLDSFTIFTHVPVSVITKDPLLRAIYESE